ncbi:MAG: hypothetical protein KZQ86_08915 [Candidatus Thiodiazotropha sp. (ex Lucinoma kastoroae)]|nr:hypothetical protein [Candidatus Thiodiazotropha sp. (ex Lucinoma kastoroae)]
MTTRPDRMRSLDPLWRKARRVSSIASGLPGTTGHRVRSPWPATIDLAYLGPLPFALLSETFGSAEPIGCFREPDGKTNYSCSLVTYGENNIDLNQLGKVQIGLTQPHSRD